MKDYALSAKAILYVAREAGAISFTGLPNELFGLDKAAETKAIQEAEDELTKAGLIVMDFDGNSAVEQELSEMVKTCSNVSQITGFDIKKPDGGSDTATVYLDRNDNLYLLTSLGMENGKYLFSRKNVDEIKEYLKSNIRLTDGEATPEDSVIESKLLIEPDKEALEAAGLSADKADLVEKAINGGAYAMTVSQNVNTVEQETQIYLWNADMTLSMDIVYEDDKENVHFRSVNAEDSFGKMFGLLERYEYPEEEYDESIGSIGEQD